MIRHAFKMIWNRKRRNTLLLVEIFFSFMVLFAVGAKIIDDVRRFSQPLGYSYENVRVLYPGSWSAGETMSQVEIRNILEQVKQELLSRNEVEQVSRVSGNIPFRNARFGTSLDMDGREVRCDYTLVDDHYGEVLDIPVVEGRWFGREDDGSSMRPIVIDHKLSRELFGEEPAVGKVITGERYDRVVVGVIDRYLYRGELMDYRGGFFQRFTSSDTSSFLLDALAFTVRPGTGYEFESQLLKRLVDITHGWPVSIESLAENRAAMMREYKWTVVIIGLVAGFLVINVALGLFGVLWYSINRRRGEIGLRRAIGASKGSISTQVLFEALVMATLAIIGGIFVAVQAPILGLEKTIGVPVYVFAMAYSTLMIYLIVSVCAFYPSRLAARIQPAEALHDE